MIHLSRHIPRLILRPSSAHYLITLLPQPVRSILTINAPSRLGIVFGAHDLFEIPHIADFGRDATRLMKLPHHGILATDRTEKLDDAKVVPKGADTLVVEQMIAVELCDQIRGIEVFHANGAAAIIG